MDSRVRGCMYTYDWSMLMYGRNWHNIIINLQLKINKLRGKKQNQKVEIHVLFGGFSEDLHSEGSLSGSSEGLLWRGEWGARIAKLLQKKKKK